MGDDNFWRISNIHGEAEYSGNSIRIKSFKKTKEDFIFPVLRGMKAKKWRGFYKDSVTQVLSHMGLSSLFERYY